MGYLRVSTRRPSTCGSTGHFGNFAFLLKHELKRSALRTVLGLLTNFSYFRASLPAPPSYLHSILTFLFHSLFPFSSLTAALQRAGKAIAFSGSSGFLELAVESEALKFRRSHL